MSEIRHTYRLRCTRCGARPGMSYTTLEGAIGQRDERVPDGIDYWHRNTCPGPVEIVRTTTATLREVVA